MINNIIDQERTVPMELKHAPRQEDLPIVSESPTAGPLPLQLVERRSGRRS